MGTVYLGGETWQSMCACIKTGRSLAYSSPVLVWTIVHGRLASFFKHTPERGYVPHTRTHDPMNVWWCTVLNRKAAPAEFTVMNVDAKLFVARPCRHCEAVETIVWRDTLLFGAASATGAISVGICDADEGDCTVLEALLERHSNLYNCTIVCKHFSQFACGHVALVGTPCL